MESFDSLLTCCICLDRFRNPKLLPCQHTFCMEPCMEGLIDYVKRQLKCPECRAEHRVPYKGIQEFPSNVTMQRFLQMYQSISGELPDPNQGQVMERCTICNEKEYLQPCAHCEKRVCADCKSAHVDVLKREVVRINAQVRRGLHKLHDVAGRLEQAVTAVRSSGQTVTAEVEGLADRLVAAVRERSQQLKAEVDAHMTTEVEGLNTLRDNLKLEIANIESNSELAEKHMAADPTAEWDDCELVDAKEIFLKTVEFIRNFEQEAPNAADLRRPIRFSAAQDPLSLHKTLEQLGELHITKSMISDGNMTNGMSNGYALAHCSSSSALARSKSDHRLAQLRQEAEEGAGSRRRFGERVVSSRRGSDDSGGPDTPLSSVERRQRYRSRMMRRTFDTDDEQDGLRQEPPPPLPTVAAEKKRESVLDTDDASRGPISGITRIADVPRVMQKLADAARGPRKKAEPDPVTAPAPVAPTPAPWRRQRSEEDEVAKIKRQNKEADARCSRAGAAAAVSATTADDSPPSPRATSTSRGSTDRHASQPSTLQRPSRVSRDESASETEDSSRRRTSRVSRPSAAAAISETTQEAPEPRRPTLSAPQRKISEPARLHTRAAPAQVSRSSSGSSLNTVSLETPRLAPLRNTWERRVSRSNSSESTSESESAVPKHTGAAFSTSELKSRFMRGGAPPAPLDAARGSGSGAGSSYSSRTLPSTSSRPPTQPAAASSSAQSHSPSSSAHTRPRFQSRFLGRAGTPKAEGSKEFTSSSACSESESESSDDSDSDTGRPGPYRGHADPDMASTSIGPLLARSAHARAASGVGADTTASVTSPVTSGLPSGRRLSRPNSLTSSYSRERGDSAAAELSTLPATTSTTPTTDRYGSRRQGATDLSPTSPQPRPRYSTSTSRYGSGDYSVGGGLVRSRTSSHLDARSASFDAHDSYTPYTSKYSSRASRPSYDDYVTPSRYSSYSSSRFLNTAEGCAALDSHGTSRSACVPASGLGGGRSAGRARSTSSREAGGPGNDGDGDASPPHPPARRRPTTEAHCRPSIEPRAPDGEYYGGWDAAGRTTPDGRTDADCCRGLCDPAGLGDDGGAEFCEARYTSSNNPSVITKTAPVTRSGNKSGELKPSRVQTARRQPMVLHRGPRSAGDALFLHHAQLVAVC